MFIAKSFIFALRNLDANWKITFRYLTAASVEDLVTDFQVSPSTGQTEIVLMFNGTGGDSGFQILANSQVRVESDLNADTSILWTEMTNSQILLNPNF